MQKKVKVKTRGEAKPLIIETIKQDTKSIEIKTKVITLDPKNYEVFQSLTGANNNRHITTQNVITLLEKGFSCKISHATGGGSHRKATAENSCVWTIPPAWDGPIPVLYRNQLMGFLACRYGHCKRPS